MKKVVIIGGGFAGAQIAKRLEKIFDVVLIDTKEYFEFTPGVLRALVEPIHLKRIQVSHKDYLKKASVIIGKAINADKKSVYIGNKKLPYDCLVVSSGSRYEPPIKMNAINSSKEGLKEYHRKIENSNRILIVGGGLVGVELAGELASGYPGKKIILVHSHDRMADRMSKNASNYFHNYLSKKGVEMIMGNKIMGKRGNSYITDKGVKINADVAFQCTGIKPNSEFMKKNFSDDIDNHGYLTVNNNLQLNGNENIFAVGDVNNIMEEKTAQNAEKQAKIVSKNIVALNNGKKLMKYTPKERIMVTSLGKYDGLITYRNIAIGGILSGILKNIIEFKTMLEIKLF